MMERLQAAGGVASLPEIRGELQFMPATPDPDGAPVWLIFDPVRERYFRLAERAAALLECWRGQSRDRFIADLEQEKGLLTDAQEIKAVEQFLRSNELTVEPLQSAVQQGARQGSQFDRFLELARNFMFLRLRLFSPARLLQSLLPVASPLLSRTAVYAVIGIAALGLYLVSRQWDAFVAEITQFMSFEGLMASLLALALAKLVHETAHALVATKYGVRVNSAGVCFYFGMPLLFTDVTGAWKLQSRRQRMLIDAAGVIAELYLAAFATLVWAFLDDGPLRSAVFSVAAVTWVTSLLVNLNPLSRFDGYYLVADLVRMPNLGPRSAALGNWFMREALFGLKRPAPEYFEPHRQLCLVTYAYASWIYRMSVMLGVSLFLYAVAFKFLAIVLMAGQVMAFIFVPIRRELQEWWKMRKDIGSSRRGRLTMALTLGVLIALFIPLPKNIRIPAVFHGSQVSQVHLKRAGKISQIAVQEGQVVQKGQLLVRLVDPELDSKLAKANHEIALLNAQLARLAAADRELNERLVLMQKLEAQKAEKAAAEKDIEELAVRAPAAGVLREMAPDLRVGSWLPKSQNLATVVAQNGAVVEGYISEVDRQGLELGRQGRFVADNPMAGSFPVKFSFISSTGVKAIAIDELSTSYGGSVVSQPDSRGDLKPSGAQYRVEFSASAHSSENAIRGVVRISGPFESFATMIFRSVFQVFVREAGF